jgi:hypothetical protein
MQGDMVRENESACGQMISKMGRQSGRYAGESPACKNACFLEPNLLALQEGNGPWEVVQKQPSGMMNFQNFLGGACGLAFFLTLISSSWSNPIVDEAKAEGKTPADFPKITADVFKQMDQGAIIGELSEEEIRGRNTWNLWTAGNQHFWDGVARNSFGLMDVLKMLDNRKYPRGERFKTLGLVNQPGFQAPSKADEYGLWLDEQTEPEPEGIDEKVYGKPTGVLGFRLFPNPDFDEAARKKWDGERFMNDPKYYNDNKLVRPYRVGVSCGSCHIAPNPVNPPADPESPKWENLASAIGNQYISEGRVFACNVQKGGLFYEMIEAQPRGTSDTSRIATDHNNNPNAINAIFLLAERERIAVNEKMAGGTLALPGEGLTPRCAYPEGWRGFGRRKRRHDTRLREYRHVLGILAYASQSPHRTRAAATVRSRLCSKELRLLARYGGTAR